MLIVFLNVTHRWTLVLLSSWSSGGAIWCDSQIFLSFFPISNFRCCHGETQESIVYVLKRGNLRDEGSKLDFLAEKGVYTRMSLSLFNGRKILHFVKIRTPKQVMCL